MFSLITGVARSCAATAQHKGIKEETPTTDGITAGKVASVIAGCFDSIGVIACIVAGTLVLIPHTHTLIALNNTHAIIIMATGSGGQLIFTLLAVTMYRHCFVTTDPNTIENNKSEKKFVTTDPNTIENNKSEKKQVGPFEIKKITFKQDDQLSSIQNTLTQWGRTADRLVEKHDVWNDKQVYRYSSQTIHLIQTILYKDQVIVMKHTEHTYDRKNLEVYIAESEGRMRSICIIEKRNEEDVEVVLIATDPNDLVVYHSFLWEKKNSIGAGAAVLYGAVTNYPEANISVESQSSAEGFFQTLGFSVKQKEDEFSIMQLVANERDKLDQYIQKKFNTQKEGNKNSN